MWDSSSGFLITWYKSLPSLASVHLFVCIMCGAAYGSTAYRLPEYTDTPANVTYYRGDRAILQCAMRHLGTKQVIWKLKKDEHVLTVGKMVYSPDKQYRVDHVGQKGHREAWNLVITNVQPKHAGLYECQISTAEDIKRYIQLNVINEPGPSREGIKITGKPFVEKGNKIVLTCNATGEYLPPDDIDWFKDGATVKQNQDRGLTISKFRLAETRTLHSQLIIDHSKMTDSGNYICRSGIDIVSTSVMVLNGKRGPNIIVPRSQDEKYTKGGEHPLAETNPEKRENKQPNTDDSSAASGLILRGESLYIYVLCALTLYYTVSRH